MIDYTQADFTSSGQTFDVIFDVAAKYKDLLHRTELIEAGALTAVIEERFPLERTADAPRRVEAGREAGRKAGNLITAMDASKLTP